jgi:hypothetical protein
VHLVGRVGDLAEALPRRLLLVDLARLGAGRELYSLVRRTTRGDTDPKKNSLSLTIGPPSEPPNSLWWFGCLVSW